MVIGGQVRKRDGRLLADVDTARRQVEASRDHLVEQMERTRAAKQQA